MPVDKQWRMYASNWNTPFRVDVQGKLDFPFADISLKDEEKKRV